MINEFKSMFNERLAFFEKISKDENVFTAVNNLYHLLYDCLESNSKILICGNGGSAADSQHIAAEFIVKNKKYRKALPAIALTSDSSVVTAVANDFSYDTIFERQIEGIGKEGDILIGLSTSGNSTNVINAFLCANKKNIKTIAITGNDNNRLALLADYKLVFNTDNTQMIQELYMMFMHMICEGIDDLYEKSSFS